MDVLDICLHHKALHAPHFICKLLVCSKQVVALVHRACHGRLDVVWPPEQPHVTWTWMAKHMVLLRSVELHGWFRHDTPAAVEGLERAAAAAAEELPLRSWRSPRLHVKALAALPSSLTTLMVHSAWHGGRRSEPAAQGADAADVALALAALSLAGAGDDEGAPATDDYGERASASTVNAALAAAIASGRLQQLRRLLAADAALGASDTPLAPALASMRHLTALVIDAVSRRHCQSLPASLCELELREVDRDGVPQARPMEWTLALTHLTALTRLVLAGDLEPADELPQSLRELEVQCWRRESVEPLLQLRHITRLQLEYCQAPDEQLRRLSALRGLQHVGVGLNATPGIGDPSPVLQEAGSSSLRLLPLKELHTVDEQLSSVALRHIGACAGLTRLVVDGGWMPASMVGELPSILAKLTALQELDWGVGIYEAGDDAEPGGGEAAGGADGEQASGVGADGERASGVMAAAAASILPRLRVLEIGGAEVMQVLAPALDGRQLTSLALFCRLLSDATVAAACSRLTGLRALQLHSTCEAGELTDGGLAAIAASLPRLSRLRLSDVGPITDAGVEQLSVLCELRELSVTHERDVPVMADTRRKALGIAW